MNERKTRKHQPINGFGALPGIGPFTQSDELTTHPPPPSAAQRTQKTAPNRKKNQNRRKRDGGGGGNGKPRSRAPSRD